MADDETENKPTKGPRVPPPPPGRQRRGIIAPPPTPSAVPDNMQKPNSGTQDLNFKVDPDFHFAVKMIATRRKMAMKELFDAAIRCWIDTYGDEQDKVLLPSKNI